MGSGVPLLNEYKQEFLWKRLPQTVLGGPKLRLGYEAPAYIYIAQVVLFLVPWVVTALLTLLVHFSVLAYDIGICITAVMMFIYVIVVNSISEYKNRTRTAISVINRNAQNILAEEDEIEFTSCCGVEAVRFVVPGKKYVVNIVLHATLSAALCGLGFWYLLPEILNGLFANNLGVTLTLHVLGWFTVCVAQYSLTVGPPPETASYDAEDPFDLTPLMRPFYCFLCFTLDLLARYYSSSLLVANQAGHVLFVILPLMWTVGFLSPLTAFFMWIIEQMLIFIFGGSAMATDLRSVLMLVLSACSYILTYFIPHGLVTTILMAAFGYLLSLDLSSLAERLIRLTRDPHWKPKQNEVSVTDHFLWHWSLREVAFHLAMLLMISGLTAALNLLVSPSAATFSNYLLYGVMGLLILEHLLTDLQSVYVLLGLWRNALFPSSTQRTTIFHKGKARLKPIGYIRRALRNFVAPLLMMSWLAMTITLPDTSLSSSTSVSDNVTNTTNTTTSFDYTIAQILGVHRTYRWIWQNTVACMLDLSIYQILWLAVPSSYRCRALPAGIQLLVISLLRDRGEQFFNKLYFYLTLLVTSWTDKKQRRQSTVPILVVNVLLFPVMLGVVGLASAMSAPLLPLFTLPIFLVGYARPWRGWPSAVGESANMCSDTVYYRHMAPQLSMALRVAAANGSIGETVVGGHYLVRLQDRLAWVQVLERGYLYVCVSIKGLELQETSCHTAEATRIDDLFETSFEPAGGVSCCAWNSYPLSVLRPFDTAYIKTYSDARNQLTGVIDSPDSLRLIADGFAQALVWVLLHHCHEKKKRGDIYLARPGTNPSKTVPALVRHTNNLSNWEKFDENKAKPEHTKSVNSTVHSTLHSRKSQFGLGENLQLDGQSINWDHSAPKRNQWNGRPLSGRSCPGSGHSSKTTASLKSLNDSWASDNESLILEEFDTRKKPNLAMSPRRELGPGAIVRDESETSIVLPMRENFNQGQLTRLPGLLSEGIHNHGNDVETTDDFFSDMDFGLPASDINQHLQKGPVAHVSFKSSHVTSKSDPLAQVQLSALSESLHFATLYSRLVSPPLHWREVPIEKRHLTPLLDKFPKAWYRHIISVMQFDVESGGVDVASEIAKDAALEDVYMKLVMVCYGIVNVLGTPGITDVVSLGPTHVHNVYSGDIPWSPSASWLQEDEELCSLVVKAFRYGVKLAVDQVLLGEVNSLEELQTYMEEYGNDYYIGLESDPGWNEAILLSTPNLFSLNYIPTQGTFSSRVLTLQDVAVHMGSVSREAVRAQWANLALELLFMTNDDEERNSIQAHATLLRNLTVQAADPPLGYPVYASVPVSLPTL